MATIDEIKQQAEAVKNATQVGENTAVRVGGALAGLADIAKAQEDNIGKKANAEEVKQSFLEQTAKNTAQDAEIAKKANAEEVNNSMQELDKKLNRNILTIEFDDDTGELNAIIGQDSTISSVSTDEDGNVIIEQNII